MKRADRANHTSFKCISGKAKPNYLKRVPIEKKAQRGFPRVVLCVGGIVVVVAATSFYKYWM